MDLRKVEGVMKEKPGVGFGDENQIITTKVDEKHAGDHRRVDAGATLQSFLDQVPISSIPGIHNSPDSFLEVKSDDYVKDAISLMYDKNVGGATIVDDVNSELGRTMDRDIGLIEFSSMVLWSLEELDRVKAESKHRSLGFLSMLEQISTIGQRKIGELAKSSLWQPFFPVHLNDTLFHVQLLFSKHPSLKVIPVVESCNSYVIGFVTEIAVVQMLLKSSGLEWFDQIAEKPLSEFRFENSSGAACIDADKSLSEALHILWEKKIDVVPVIVQKTGTLLGSVRCSDVYLLLDDTEVFKNRKSITAADFIKSSVGRIGSDTDSATDSDNGALFSAGVLQLNDRYCSRMDVLVTNLRSDTLKQAMEKLVTSKNNCSFLVTESGQIEGVITLRDIISQLSPPSMDSKIDGGGFFDSALEQAGCHLEDGDLVLHKKSS